MSKERIMDSIDSVGEKNKLNIDVTIAYLEYRDSIKDGIHFKEAVEKEMEYEF